jgi:hypothetical protein
MKTKILISTIVTLSLCGLFLMAEEMSTEQKAKIGSMLKDLKEKAKNSKPEKYEVALPVASAGARGAEMKQADRFAVIWPDSGIAPLSALAENLQYGMAHAEKIESLRSQMEEFKKAFPEFADEKLLKDLEAVISSST